MRHLYILILICLQCSFLTAQTDDALPKKFYAYKNEIGINVTNVLGNVLSLNPNNASSPYGLTYRRHFDKWSLRTGMNINVDNLNEDDFSDGSFITRKLNRLGLNTRIGVERHMVLSKRFMFSYGLDALLGIEREHSEINGFNFGGTTFINVENTMNYGLGPVLRFEYKISERLFISTESTLYANYSEKSSELTINGVKEEDPKKTNSQLHLILPQSLFFNISF